MIIDFAKGSYGKFKITVPGEDLVAANQVHAFVYNEKGQILKSFARDAQSEYSIYGPVDGDTASMYIEMVPNNTKGAAIGKYFVDVQIFKTVGSNNFPMHNPSFNDDNVIFNLCESVAKDKSPS